ncbi:hypothetical protein F4780DRAFT_382365 [Xylariomycetidae sp. FL0641]|nr:hypothetical protein F4780DRAFT_382365 [Xylariomycetidae sp. FL0641]
MSLPPSTRCCRAIRDNLRPRYDHIWIPESLLTTAFDRCRATLRAAARYGSSVPGPMENRRRLGRRHMAEMHMVEPNFERPDIGMPQWTLADLSDLMQWKWKPPAPPGAPPSPNAQHEPNLSLRDAFNQYLQSILPGTRNRVENEEDEDPISSDHGFLPEDTVLEGVAESERLVASELESAGVIWDASDDPSIHSRVVEAMLKSLLQDCASATSIVRSSSNLELFCYSWEKAVAAGSYSGEGICHTLESIQRNSDRFCREATDQFLPFDDIKLQLYDTTINGLLGKKQTRATTLDYGALNYILHAISGLNLSNVRIFTKAIDYVGGESFEPLASGILANLNAIFQGLGRSSKPWTLARQAAKLAVPLSKVSREAAGREMLQNATEHMIRRYARDSEGYAKLRFGWLQVLARLPHVDEKQFAQLCVKLEAEVPKSEPVRPYSAMEICNLFLARANSRGLLKEATTLYNKPREPLDRRLTSSGAKLPNGSSIYYWQLAEKCWDTGQFALVHGMSRFLRDLRREQDIVCLAEAVRSCVKPDIRKLASAAISIGDPLLAIDVISLFDRSGRGSMDFWRSARSNHALRLLTNCHDMPMSRLMKALELFPLPRGRRSVHARSAKPGAKRRRRLGRGIGQRHLWRATKAAITFARTPRLSRRQSLAMTEHCFYYIRDHNVEVPSPVLRALLYVVTRDLAEGRPGRTSRLRWILSQIQKKAGYDEMIRTGLALRRRRDRNAALAKASMKAMLDNNGITSSPFPRGSL